MADLLDGLSAPTHMANLVGTQSWITSLPDERKLSAQQGDPGQGVEWDALSTGSGLSDLTITTTGTFDPAQLQGGTIDAEGSIHPSARPSPVVLGDGESDGQASVDADFVFGSSRPEGELVRNPLFMGSTEDLRQASSESTGAGAMLRAQSAPGSIGNYEMAVIRTPLTSPEGDAVVPEHAGELGPPSPTGHAGPATVTSPTVRMVERPSTPADPELVAKAMEQVELAKQQVADNQSSLRDLEMEYRSMFHVDSIGASHGYQIYNPSNDPAASVKTRAIMQARVNTQATIARIKRALQEVWSERDDAEHSLATDKRQHRNLRQEQRELQASIVNMQRYVSAVETSYLEQQDVINLLVHQISQREDAKKQIAGSAKQMQTRLQRINSVTEQLEAKLAAEKNQLAAVQNEARLAKVGLLKASELQTTFDQKNNVAAGKLGLVDAKVQDVGVQIEASAIAVGLEQQKLQGIHAEIARLKSSLSQHESSLKQLSREELVQTEALSMSTSLANDYKGQRSMDELIMQLDQLNQSITGTRSSSLLTHLVPDSHDDKFYAWLDAAEGLRPQLSTSRLGARTAHTRGMANDIIAPDDVSLLIHPAHHERDAYLQNTSF